MGDILAICLACLCSQNEACSKLPMLLHSFQCVFLIVSAYSPATPSSPTAVNQGQQSWSHDFLLVVPTEIAKSIVAAKYINVCVILI